MQGCWGRGGGGYNIKTCLCVSLSIQVCQSYLIVCLHLTYIYVIINNILSDYIGLAFVITNNLIIFKTFFFC